MTGAPAVKVCGLTRREDAVHAAAAGADLLGVILAPGRRTVTPETAARLLEGLAPRRVGVFVNAPVQEVLAAIGTVRLDVVQLHGDEDPEYIARIRQAWEGDLWRALRPRSGGELLTEAERFAGRVDGLLLDGWSAAARGGTGTRFPWPEVAAVRDRLPEGLRLIVAGGLTPENVAEAVRILHPAVVDVSSGVERSPGEKDADAVTRFIARARSVGGVPSTE